MQRQLAIDSLVRLSAVGSSAVIGLIASVLYARMSGASLYGEFVHLFATVQLVGQLSHVAFSQAAVRVVPPLLRNRDGSRGESLTTAAWLTALGVLLLVTGTWYALAFWTNSATGILSDSALELIPLTIATGAVTALSAPFRIRSQVRQYSVIAEVIVPLLRLVIFLATVRHLGPYAALRVSAYISFIVGLLVLFVSAHYARVFAPCRGVSLDDYSFFIRTAPPMFMLGAIAVLQTRLDVVILGTLASASDVAVYNIARRIAQIPLMALMAFNTVFAPLISAMWSTGDTAALTETYRVGTRWVLALAGLVTIHLIVFGEALLSIYGSSFASNPNTTVLTVVAAGHLFSAAVGPVGYLLAMTGKPYLNLICDLGGLILLIALSLVLVPLIDALGAALASFAFFVVSNGLRVVGLAATRNITPFDRFYAKTLVSLGVVACVAGLVRMLLDPSGLLPLLFSLFLGAAAFLVTYGRLGPTAWEKRNLQERAQWLARLLRIAGNDRP